MKLPFFSSSKKTDDERAREQARKQQKKDEKARLAELKKAQKAHDALVKQAAKDEKKRVKREASEWKKHEKLLRAREKHVQKQTEAREKQERKRVQKLARQHANARRREARRQRKQLMRHRRKVKKLRKLQKKQRSAVDPAALQPAIDELLAATALTQAALQPAPQDASATAPVFAKRANCFTCHTRFRLTRVRYHCRNCGESSCRACLSPTLRSIPWHGKPKPQRVCRSCDVRVFSDRAVADSAPDATAASVSAAPSASPPASTASSVSQRPASGSGISVSLASRSGRLRRNRSAPLSTTSSSTSSTASNKKPSLWTLPIRPLLKRKRSVEQLRNRQLDFALQLEKAAQLSRQSQRALAIELQPQYTALAAPLARAS